jgi:DNA-binding MarR family transcriptional regulator
MTVARFDELIHQSTRLSIMSLLGVADWIEFAFIRDQLELSDSALSKQLATLEGAGYVILDHVVGRGRRRLRAQLTPTGRAAFDGHVAALQEIVGGIAPRAPLKAHAAGM